jgi:3-deoxy-D-manno-octulosonate 8-phosphate phosphatase (KDO 8-P phosphatase)
MNEIREIFSGMGGKFISEPENIRDKFKKIKAIIFDWDGVFNDGIKFGEEGSLFSEPDSMGTNLLRFNYYLTHNRLLKTYIVTGLYNPSAVTFAKREHFDGIFLNYRHKEEALKLICEQNEIRPDEIAFIFDDVLDLAVARLCLLSILVRRRASPLMEKFVLAKGICDYVTGREGGEYAVREVAELLMGLSGKFDETIEKRIEFNGLFTEYFEARQQVVTEVKKFS